MSTLKLMVLRSFKKLHRTRIKVFAGDVKALTAARIKINEEYRKNVNVNNIDSIKTLIKFGEDVERELRTQVIQAKEIKQGVYVARITKDTAKLDNIPFNDKAILDGVEGRKPCGQDDAQNK